MEKTPWSSVPKLDFIVNKEEFRKKFTKSPESPQEFIIKKRKLSNYSENSTNSKNESLNESFSNLNITNSSIHQAKFQTTIEVKIPQPLYYKEGARMLTSLPIKENNSNVKTENINIFKKFAIEKNFMHIGGNMKIKGSTLQYSEVKNQKKLLPPFLYMPFGVPMNIIDVILKSDKKVAEEEKTRFIGPLTLTERNEKLKKYQEKKKNRKWKSIRYNIRKDLADQRERFQGRFVKTNKSTLLCFKDNGLINHLENKSSKV